MSITKQIALSRPGVMTDTKKAGACFRWAAGQSENEIIELDGEEIPLFAKDKLSEHQVGFQEVLGLAQFLGKYPKHLRVIGVKPVDVAFGIGLSPSAAVLLPHVIERTCSALRQWQALSPVVAITP